MEHVETAANDNGTPAPKPRGFAAMDPARVREIARIGGIAGHVKGTAHKWTVAEAREAGAKGGRATHANKKVA
jgi:general stress protein YciG